MAVKMFSLYFLVALVVLVHRALGQCQSYGLDFVDGGSYFQNISSSDDFTFISYFEGCAGEGSITPILVDPNENEYFCSDIDTSPDDTYFTSTCPITKSELFTGTWYIVLEGPDFAFTRTFYLTVGIPITITATPTDFFGVTITPNATTTTLFVTETDSVTLPPSTSTIPCKTVSKVTTITPTAVTVYSTKTVTKTKVTGVVTVSTSVIITRTATCTPYPYPPKADHKIIGKWHLPAHRRSVPDTPVPRRLVQRAPDAATTTVTETTYTSNSTTTVTLPTVTSTESDYVTTTLTITPTPITVCHGVTVVKITITEPTPTRTKFTKTVTTVYTIKTVSIVEPLQQNIPNVTIQTDPHYGSKTDCISMELQKMIA